MSLYAVAFCMYIAPEVTLQRTIATWFTWKFSRLYLIPASFSPFCSSTQAKVLLLPGHGADGALNYA